MARDDVSPLCRLERLRYVDHVLGFGVALFELACENDLEGVVGSAENRRKGSRTTGHRGSRSRIAREPGAGYSGGDANHGPGDQGGTQPQTAFGGGGDPLNPTAEQTSPGGQEPSQIVSIWQDGGTQAEPVPEGHGPPGGTQRHPVAPFTVTPWQTLPDGQFPPHVG